jgi:hypothetical protein
VGKMSEEYQPYSYKWEKEIGRLPKKIIIKMLGKMGLKLNMIDETLVMIESNYCQCIDAYKERGLIDPRCPVHYIVEEIANVMDLDI